MHMVTSYKVENVEIASDTPLWRMFHIELTTDITPVDYFEVLNTFLDKWIKYYNAMENLCTVILRLLAQLELGHLLRSTVLISELTRFVTFRNIQAHFPESGD